MIDWDHAYSSGQHLQQWDFHAPSPELVSFLASGSLPHGSTFLDIGCGTGHDAFIAAQTGMNVFAIDISFQALALANQQAQPLNVSWCAATALTVPFANNSFRFVNDRGCLHHIKGEDRHRYFGEIARLLSKEGCLMVRGASTDMDNFFEPILPDTVDHYLQANHLKRGELLPIIMVANDGRELEGNITFISKDI